MGQTFEQGSLIRDERRRFARSSAFLNVRYRWLDYSGEATTADVSVNGCRITKADLRGVVRGSLIILSLEIPGQTAPILVNPAKVQWVSHDRFGVQFLSSKDTDQRRLDAYIKELEAVRLRKM
jgi:c-di-GMP-binding flagellar brake protein YcgR